MNLELTKKWEGLRLQAYQDQAGVWTIGYGHTSGVKKGDTCTVAQALMWLVKDFNSALDSVKKLVTVPVNDNQLEALGDFVYNLGETKFAGSTLLKLLNQSDYQGASNEFLKWNKIRINGVLTPSEGLTNRRREEQQLFLR